MQGLLVEHTFFKHKLLKLYVCCLLNLKCCLSMFLKFTSVCNEGQVKETQPAPKLNPSSQLYNRCPGCKCMDVLTTSFVERYWEFQGGRRSFKSPCFDNRLTFLKSLDMGIHSKISLCPGRAYWDFWNCITFTFPELCQYDNH